MKEKEQPIRIAQIIGKWLGGGVESVVMNYYRNIDREKIQFDFICDEDSTNIPYEEIQSLGGKVILIPAYQKIFKYQKELKKILEYGKYEIVHSHINALSVFPLRAAKKAGIPIRIAHSHSTTNKSEWKKNLLKQFLRMFSTVYATDYFACTEHAGRWLFGEKLFQEEKMLFINNAINLEKYKFNDQVRKIKRKELGISDDTIVIGHIGRFVKQKNHDFLIDIFNEINKKNKKALLLLIGQGPLENEIKDKIKSFNLQKYVKLLGQKDNVNEYYSVFDRFIFPSLYEGLGMVLIEAQCSGCYCFASTEIPIVAKVSDNIKFIDLKKSPQYWAEMILNSKENISRNNQNEILSSAGYNIKIEAEKLEKIYLEL